MIPSREILALRGEWQLRADVIEKDWALGWLLAGIADHTALRGWVFKGGTCLRKCYYETYRLSEDLDFTVVGGGPESPDDLMPIFTEIAAWLAEHAGLELVVDERSFVRRRNRRGNPTTQGRLAYRGPTNPPTLPKVRLDLTSDEVVVHGAERRPVLHPYSDAPDPSATVDCYTIVELLAEKLRALVERCRPRDLYDVIHVYRHPDLLGRAAAVVSVLDQKCAHAGVAAPDLAGIHASPYRAEIETEWSNMLAHQLPSLPPFEQFWSGLEELFAWLGQKVALPTLRRAEFGELDPEWRAPRSMTTWGSGAPLELIRFAGANRLKVELDYRAEQGRWGKRIVEPYSLRFTRDGNLVLFVVNDRGQLRSYRVDRIAGVGITRESFIPRFVVEF
jgi:predicted nucleotidyltransferase component of viral defense system